MAGRKFPDFVTPFKVGDLVRRYDLNAPDGSMHSGVGLVVSTMKDGVIVYKVLWQGDAFRYSYYTVYTAEQSLVLIHRKEEAHAP